MLFVGGVVLCKRRKAEKEGVMEAKRLESLKQIAAGVAAQFGDKCEVVIHDVASSHPEHTIVHIENGHVSGRKIGDGASRVVMEQLEHQNEQPQDHLCYLTKTKDGKILLTWKKSKGYKVDKFEIYRSVKRNSGYGKKPFFTTKGGSRSQYYLNTKKLKAGRTYYYKVRGVRIIDGKKYYTHWSNKVWRSVK